MFGWATGTEWQQGSSLLIGMTYRSADSLLTARHVGRLVTIFWYFVNDEQFLAALFSSFCNR